MTIADLRREYNLTGLRRRDLAADPIKQFETWFAQVAGARASGRLRQFCIRIYKSLVLGGAGERSDINAMTLATVDSDGRPSARVVLLKGVDQRGVIFYPNYHRRKGHEWAGNANAALVFYWPEHERQVCVAGKVSQLPVAESDAYFASRPRGSRIAAWASEQSAVVADRTTLETQWQKYERQFPGAEVPRPPQWGGYVLIPERVEFWQGRPNRLHDRFRYTRQPDSSWRIERLSP